MHTCPVLNKQVKKDTVRDTSCICAIFMKKKNLTKFNQKCNHSAYLKKICINSLLKQNC